MLPADLPAVLQLARATPESPQWSDAEYARFVVPCAPQAFPATGRQHRAWVTQASGQLLLAGFAAGTLLRVGDYTEAELEHIVVATTARRQGIGLQLLRTFLRWAHENRAETVRLEVRPSNLPAIRLYHQAGFVRNGLRRGYYRNPDEDAILFALGAPRTERL